MPIHRTATMPVPGDALARIRSDLARRYGATVVEEDGKRVLVIRVPREQPDPVNDVEDCIEYLSPKDVEDIQQCILVGDEAAAQVYAGPIQQFMEERVRFDRRQCQEWRQRMPGKLGHTLYQSPEDPRRRWRLAVRIPTESVKDLEEDHLDALADGLGPQLESPRLQSLAAVYLIAGTDDVRLEPDMFVQQLVEAWKDEERKRRIELELAQKKEAARRRKEAERNTLLRELDTRFRRHERVMQAPVRTGPGDSRTGHQGAGGIDGHQGARADRPLAESESTIQGAPPRAREVRDRVERLTRQVEDVEAKVGLKRVRRGLEDAGFDVLLDPETPGHVIDVAAERPDGDPQRVVVRVVERLTTDVAKELLKTARELEVDAVLCVTPHVEPEGKRLLVATKVKAVHPDELGDFRF